jgi:hypothetical protein
LDDKTPAFQFVIVSNMAASTEGESDAVYSFRDETFLTTYHLAIGNALEYFGWSNFYDPISLNEQAKQNRQTSFDMLVDSIDGVSFRIVLACPRGGAQIQGADLKKPANQAVDVNPGLIVIDKVSRVIDKANRDVRVDTVLKKFYILDGTIYEAPDLYAILSARARSAMFHVRESLREVRKMFEWTLETGFRKRIAAHETETRYEFRASELREITGEVQDEFRLQTALLDALLGELGIMEQNPPV